MTEAARQKILELCSEDDYGVWEIFGAVVSLFKNEDSNGSAKKLFIRIIQDLIKERLVVSKVKNHTTSQLEEVAFDADTLALQLKNLTTPDPESFYWFGLPKKY